MAAGLPESTPTLAKILQSQGYSTSMVGKWHLGLEKKSRPNNHGFDNWFGFLAGNVDYYSHIYYYGANTKDSILPQVNPTHDLWENEKEVWMANCARIPGPEDQPGARQSFGGHWAAGNVLQSSC